MLGQIRNVHKLNVEAGLYAARPPPTVLNFFKPISNGTAKKSSQKRVLPQVAPPLLKRTCLAPLETVDLVSSDEQPIGRVQKSSNLEGEEVLRPPNGQRRPPHSLSTPHRQQDVQSEGEPATLDKTHVQDAALGSSVSAMTQTAQEEQLQRSDSSGINPSMAPVRRFKGVPYAPDADSIQFLTNMVFSQDQAIRALKVTQGNIERAANWLLSGM